VNSADVYRDPRSEGNSSLGGGRRFASAIRMASQTSDGFHVIGDGQRQVLGCVASGRCRDVTAAYTLAEEEGLEARAEPFRPVLWGAGVLGQGRELLSRQLNQAPTTTAREATTIR
jgi:hypothetical protein